MKSIKTFVLIAIMYLQGCQQSKKDHTSSNGIDFIIEKHNIRLENIPLLINVEDKDLLVEIEEGIRSTQFQGDQMKDKVQRLRNYHRTLSIEYDKVSTKTIFQLDSLLMRNDFEIKDRQRIENLKGELIIIQAQLSRLRLESVIITGAYENLIDLRKKCIVSDGKSLRFRSEKCESDFNLYVTKINNRSLEFNKIKESLQSLN